MISSRIQGVEFVAANSDFQDLHKSGAPVKLQIGKNLSRGLGAGMFIHTGSPKLIDCTFEGNAAGRGGGGLYGEAGSSPVLTGCTFKLNFAMDGAGVMVITGRSSWP